MKTIKGTFTAEDGKKYRGTLEVEDTGRFVPVLDDAYWYVKHDGTVDWCYCRLDSTDNFLLSQGNVFHTKAEAQAHLEYLKAVAVIKEDAEWWGPDWSDWNQKKWYGFYSNYAGELESEFAYEKQLSDIYFPTGESLQASQTKHRKEWLTMFGVSED